MNKELMILAAGVAVLLFMDKKEQERSAAAKYTMQPVYDQTLEQTLAEWGFYG